MLLRTLFFMKKSAMMGSTGKFLDFIFFILYYELDVESLGLIICGCLISRSVGKIPLKIIGLDVGSKKIGVAVSDDMGWTAQGVSTIIRKNLDSDMCEIERLVNEYMATEIVVGLPKNMDGTIGKQAEGVLALAETIKTYLNIPVTAWDERLSTRAANRALLEADLSRRKRKKVVDKMAAVFILQGYLDSKTR